MIVYNILIATDENDNNCNYEAVPVAYRIMIKATDGDDSYCDHDTVDGDDNYGDDNKCDYQIVFMIFQIILLNDGLTVIATMKKFFHFMVMIVALREIKIIFTMMLILINAEVESFGFKVALSTQKQKCQ